jgi:uncharacterized MAPEG superfamily protein
LRRANPTTSCDEGRDARARHGWLSTTARRVEGAYTNKEQGMALVVVLLLLALLFGGLGFAIHALWIVAVVLALVWIVGFLVGGAERGRWYGRSW